VDDRVLDAMLPTGLNMHAAADEVGKLLIAHPLAICALLSHMFTSGSARVPLATKNKCARLIALATLASERKHVLRCLSVRLCKKVECSCKAASSVSLFN
jgi:hypothetical protein